MTCFYLCFSYNSSVSDSNSVSNRGLYSGNSSSRTTSNHKQSNPASSVHRNASDVETVRAKNSDVSSRMSAKVSTTQPSSKASALATDSSTAAHSSSFTKRTRGAKLNLPPPQGPGVQEQLVPTQPPTVPQTQPEPPADISRIGSCNASHPEYFGSGGNTRHSSDDSDITNLIEVMDKDFDNSEPPPSDVFSEQPPSPAAKNKGNVKIFCGSSDSRSLLH